MSYVLDGIPTRFVVKSTGPQSNLYRCGCGWGVRLTVSEGPPAAMDTFAALRFHYTHCPHARLPRGEVDV